MAESIRDKVAIVGMGCTKFGERWDASLEDLLVEAGYEAFEDAKLAAKDIQAAWVGTVASEYTGQFLANALKFDYIPITRVENAAPASIAPVPASTWRREIPRYFMFSFPALSAKLGTPDPPHYSYGLPAVHRRNAWRWQLRLNTSARDRPRRFSPRPRPAHRPASACRARGCGQRRESRPSRPAYLRRYDG